MESGECIGQIAYFLVDQTGSWGEIEYAIGTAYQGKGYATEATKAVIDYGFKNIGFHKVQICVRPSNIKSKRVIEKCGFEYASDIDAMKKLKHIEITRVETLRNNN